MKKRTPTRRPNLKHAASRNAVFTTAAAVLPQHPGRALELLEELVSSAKNRAARATFEAGAAAAELRAAMRANGIERTRRAAEAQDHLLAIIGAAAPQPARARPPKKKKRR